LGGVQSDSIDIYQLCLLQFTKLFWFSYQQGFLGQPFDGTVDLIYRWPVGTATGRGTATSERKIGCGSFGPSVLTEPTMHNAVHISSRILPPGTPTILKVNR
jgi:hypothetical protein